MGILSLEVSKIKDLSVDINGMMHQQQVEIGSIIGRSEMGTLQIDCNPSLADKIKEQLSQILEDS